MLSPRIVVVVTGLMTLSAPTVPKVVVAHQDRETLDAQIIDFQTKRVEALKRAVAMLQVQYRQGAVDFRHVLAAQLNLTDAVLATANTADERIALLEEQLQIAQRAEDAAVARYRSTIVGTAVDAQEAKAARLHIQIKLLQEQRQKLAANS